ncbi:Monocopper oxidase-like protein SKS2 [Hibiscus syriacus]|uniref:Monocopper oxidase-like protein SKS2 n=1 Tax=Hibiscus syriacus TaxID=106335 RepID=A0A6A2ZTQ1_HIBSY|nr:Monocopper oxidase-like protein SKS2 [Hibiscus syriacus]
MAQPFLLHIALLSTLCFADDLLSSMILNSPTSPSPLSVIAVNGAFPGSVVNATTNYNVVVNVHNQLDENLLMTWSGVQMRRNSWQDGVLDGDIVSGLVTGIPRTTRLALRATLDSVKKLRMPDGVFINGKEPYRYNSTLVPDGNEYETINVGPGKLIASECIMSGYRLDSHRSAAAASSDVYSQWSSMNQPRAIRQNTTASRARPNPQGSFHYGSINVTETLVIRSLPPIRINGKLRAALNGISFVKPDTPIRLADLHNNNDTKIQSFHLDGYSFFVGVRNFIHACTHNNVPSAELLRVFDAEWTLVYPGGWTAVFVSLDNVGVWNLRVENLDRWYLGQETYMRIINPEENGKTELAPPDNVLYCGALQSLQKESASSAAMALHCDNSKLLINLVRTILPFIIV